MNTEQQSTARNRWNEPRAGSPRRGPLVSDPPWRNHNVISRQTQREFCVDMSWLFDRDRKLSRERPAIWTQVVHNFAADR
jgi:hypothetical protein